MFYETLSFQKEDHVMIINLLGRIKEQEKIDRFFDEFSEVCTEISSDKDVLVVIINWDVKNSLPEANMDKDVIGYRGHGIEFASLSEIVSGIDHPVIAAINGDAIGQALELVLACDIRVASEVSHFGLPYIIAGMIPWDGGTQRLPRLVGKGKAIEMILTGEIINAHEAHRIGLVNKIVPAKDLMTTVIDIAQEMASKGPIALKHAKEAILKGMDLTLEQGLRLEADLYFLLHTTSDRTEGIKAFQEKRHPQFKGR